MKFNLTFWIPSLLLAFTSTVTAVESSSSRPDGKELLKRLESLQNSLAKKHPQIQQVIKFLKECERVTSSSSSVTECVMNKLKPMLKGQEYSHITQLLTSMGYKMEDLVTNVREDCSSDDHACKKRIVTQQSPEIMSSLQEAVKELEGLYPGLKKKIPEISELKKLMEDVNQIVAEKPKDDTTDVFEQTGGETMEGSDQEYLKKKKQVFEVSELEMLMEDEQTDTDMLNISGSSKQTSEENEHESEILLEKEFQKMGISY